MQCLLGLYEMAQGTTQLLTFDEGDPWLLADPLLQKAAHFLSPSEGKVYLIASYRERKMFPLLPLELELG